MENTRGSEWRKWDLHLHTASSYDYKYKGADPDKKLIETLKNNDISVVAITDHFVIDKDRILNLRKIASDMSYNLVIFPGVELRTDKGGSNIHPIIIFDCETDLNILTEEFNSFKRKKAIDDENNETIRWDFKDIVNFANENNGIITIHAGNKKNGIDEQISNVLPVKIATKDEYAQTVNILEIGKLEDIDEYKKYKFPKIGIKPFIMGSDNHNPNKYPNEHNTNLFTWIKADTTFEGLKQIIFEPEERVRIQKTDPTLDYDKSPFTEIEITDNVKVFENAENNIYFAKNRIPLNSGLVSIIGGRGTGKSILIDYIAKGLGNSTQLIVRYSRSDKMCVKRKVSLQEQEFPFYINEEHYLPFLYIHQSEIKYIVEQQNQFSDKIFQLIGMENNKIFGEEYGNKIFIERWSDLYIGDNKGIDRLKVIDTEIKKYQSFITNIISEQNKKTFDKYLKALRLLDKLLSFKAEITICKESIQSLQEEYTKQIDRLNAMNSIEYFEDENQYELFTFNNQTIVNLDTIIPNNNKTIYIYDKYLSEINKKIEYVHIIINKTKKELPNYEGNLPILIDDVQRYQESLNNLYEERNKIMQSEKQLTEIYQNDLSKRVSYIKNQIKSFEESIKNKWQAFVNGNEVYSKERMTLLNEILGGKKEKIDLHIKFYLDINKLQEKIRTSIIFRGRNTPAGFSKEFNSIELKHLQLINKIIEIIDNLDLETYLKYIEYSSEGLQNILSNPYFIELYCGFNDFIKYKIDITSDNKPFNQLSVGQRGSIYLRLQLAANLFSKTIIYDQPEDDLDNEFITNSLVDLFKKIKKYRQVIIVSHNANLVVNADSEQVIVASNNDGVLSYKSGSLENPEIKTEICRILEGGKEAFDKRKLKYGF